MRLSTGGSRFTNHRHYGHLAAPFIAQRLYVGSLLEFGGGYEITPVVGRFGYLSHAALADMLKDKPIGRLITPEEVADAVLFLCSPGASAITGTTLTVAGGEI